MFERHFFAKKLTTLLAVCLALVMLTNFASDGLRFKTSERIMSAYALEQDDDENSEDNDEEDIRYVNLLSLVFSEEQAELETTEDGDVTFEGTCSLFENMEDVYINEFNISCSLDVENMTFYLEQDSELYVQSIESEALVSDYDGSLYAEIVAGNTTLYSNWYTSDYSFSELLRGITHRDLISVFGFENIAPQLDPIELESDELGVSNDALCISNDELCVLNGDLGVLNQDYDKSNSTNSLMSGWGLFAFIVAVVVVVYVIVCETAEQIQAEKNLVHNRELEEDLVETNDIPFETYITGQTNSNVAEYKLGFANFDEVGCEVAAVYNLLISLDRAEMLSDVIYNFEKWSIEYAVGWGHLGSSPRQIYKYLKKRGIAYKKYVTLNSFRRAVASTDSDNYIYSAWNERLSAGLHTFYVNRIHSTVEGVTSTSYNAYNYHGDDSEPLSTTNFADYHAEYTLFIIGYIIL